MAIGTPVSLGNVNSVSSGSLSLTTAAAVTAGDMICIGWECTSAGTTVTNVTTTAGDTGFLQTIPTTTPNVLGTIWFANAIGMATSSNITVTFSATVRCTMRAFKVSGMNTVAAQLRDPTASPATTSGTGTSASLTSNGLYSNSELLIWQLGNGASNPSTVTPPSGFTLLGTADASNCFQALGYQVVSSPFPVAANGSWVNSVTFRASLLAFKGAQTGGNPGQLTTLGVG